ncbi:MAG: putative CtpA-like serine protease [Bacteroidetes bacterium ADurb.Bin416]|jgi:carboxyl-terminal processing protease|nr:MAG: putative CtpA-like serine protease [Bacteroidetes bacterium ADurb.Bin416]
MLQHVFRIRLIAGLIVASVLLSTATVNAQRSFEVARQWDILHMLYRELDQYYVDSLSPEKVLTKAINGLMSSYDPYTNYVPESETGDLKFMTTGEYGGVGAVIGQRRGKVYILEPYENMPAQRAGFKAGDEILQIDNIKMEEATSQRASELLKGEPGTEVTITISREGSKKPIKHTIVRELVQINQVTYYGLVEPGVGYINLNGFTDKAAREVQAAVLSLKAQGAQKLILDLRGNGGGLVNEAVAICNLFVPKGQEIVSTRGKQRQWDQTYKTTKEPIDTLIPLVVMVDRGSASSSEIVCGALQDLDRAVIVGSRTFGKGLVQTTRSIPYNGMLKVTTAKYYIPSGRCIQAIDYSNRNEDGSVGRIPDSLTHVFSTRAGRQVRDGGGIQPDIVCENEWMSTMSYYLSEGMYFFDYANEYARKNATIPPVEEFTLSEEVIADFLRFVKERGFTYEKDSKKVLNELKSTLKEEAMSEMVKEELAALEAKLDNNIDADFVTYRKEVELLLSSEIVSRYHYQAGELQQSLKFDRCLKEATRVLNDMALYRNKLKPSN